jgi:hypothetical protein
MRNYRSGASSAVRIEYGVALHAGLTQFSETAAAATDVETINEALVLKERERIQLRFPVLKARATVRFAEFNVDKVIGSAKRAAEIADGGRRGKISVALFPHGLLAVTKASGSAQVKPTKELIERLVHTKVAGIETFRATWLGKLETALAHLETAIATHETARAAYDDAFNAEMALRAAHHDLIDKVMGIVRAAFPRDRDIQDVIFPNMGGDTPKKASERRDDPVATATNPAPATP